MRKMLFIGLVALLACSPAPAPPAAAQAPSAPVQGAVLIGEIDHDRYDATIWAWTDPGTGREYIIVNKRYDGGVTMIERGEPRE